MGRIITNLQENWRFSRDFPEKTRESAELSLGKDFSDESWRIVSVPHDWAVEGPFSAENDAQKVKVHADGILTDTTHIGRTGGLPHTGLGVYRRKFQVSKESKHTFLEFDGVMSYGEIYVNGKKVGERPYGYASYSLDVTEFVQVGENQLAVLANPKEGASRWYPGAGIYRPVRLVELQEVFVAFNGTFVTWEIAENVAKIHLETKISGNTSAKDCNVVQELYAPNGLLLEKVNLAVADVVTCEYSVDNPQLWDLNATNQYCVVTKIVKNNLVIDEYKTKFGIRTVEITRKEGFKLNGQKLQLNGVCLHHDSGMLGTKTNRSALKRQFGILQKMGCNAIRTSHNPASREFMDLCDEMGFLVIEEAFDEWKAKKVPNSYSDLFDDWAKIDLVSMIHRDRNRPSVMMWSIGNEILEQHDPEGKLIARFLHEICKREDPTRLTTAGINCSEDAIKHDFCDEFDVVGFNYKPHIYERYLKEHPNWAIFGSETESVVSSRGVYHHPVEGHFQGETHPSGHLSSYDVSGMVWSCPPEQEFAAQEDNPEIMGEFVWTGFDYLGEPSPFRKNWPSHASYFGIVDMAGIPQDRFYAYQAKWTKEPVVHLFPHWNWAGYQKLDMHCHSNCHSVELFVNGNSQGVATLDKSLKVVETSGKCDQLERFRFIWKDVAYVPGTVEARGYDQDGNFVKSHLIKTAGNPARIELIPEKTLIPTGDLCYIRVKVVDYEGNLCPNADFDIDFQVEGSGVYLASDSGDQTSLRIFSEPYCPVFHGQCTLVLQGVVDGLAKITATAEMLNPGQATVFVGDSGVID